MSLMDEIRSFRVSKNAVALWWLGQNGYIFKSPGGAIVGVDLYLSNSCAGSGKWLFRQRDPALCSGSGTIVRSSVRPPTTT